MNTVANRPYPRPFDGDLQPANTALVVVDMQTDFCGVGGYVDKLGCDLSLTRAPIGPTGRVLAAMRGWGGHAIHTREGHRPGLPDLPDNKRWRSRRSGTDGVDIADPGLCGRILVLTGITTDVCVHTRLREANDRGYDCLLVMDATASYFPDFKAQTVEMIVAQGGIVGWAAPLAAVPSALEGKGSVP